MNTSVYQGIVDFLKDLLYQAIGHWGRSAVSDTLKVIDGRNIQVLIEQLLPELRSFGNSQTATAYALPPMESRHRLENALCLFVRAISKLYTHPMMAFLDDIQWAAPSSVSLIQSLMRNTTVFFILSYRANSKNQWSSVTKLEEEAQKRPKFYHKINLPGLSLSEVRHLAADMMGSSISLIEDLASTLHHKTKGNPFFLTKLISYLVDENLLRFDFGSQSWCYNLKKIKDISQTESIGETISKEIAVLDEPTRDLLARASCIGYRFDFSTLTLISGLESHTAIAILSKATYLGFIQLQKADYLRDRKSVV